MQVLIDTDPGGDDAIALMWLASLCHQKRVTLTAITTAAGNVGAEKTWRNAHGLLKLCAREDTPIAIGDETDATRDAAEIHGEDGIGNLAQSLPAAPASSGRPGSVALLEKILLDTAPASKLLAVAPLTNLARAEASSPGILRKAGDIFIMGGALKAGNVTPAAEFNFYFDPAAAATVLMASDRPHLVTLETSSSLRLDRDFAGKIVSGLEAAPAAGFFTSLCDFMARREQVFAGRPAATGFPVHDAATVAWLAYPELFRFSELGVAVDIKGDENRGRLRQSDGPEASACRLATNVDADALLSIMGRDLRFLFELLQAGVVI